MKHGITGSGRIHPRCCRGAFSLLELVMVMVIIGILAAMAAPRYYSSQANYHVQAAAKRIAADLSMAKARARATSSTVSVTFDRPGNSYTIAGLTDLDHSARSYTVRLREEPYSSTLASAFSSGGQVSFNGYGIPSAGGSVVVTSGDFSKTVTLDAQSGEISIP